MKQNRRITAPVLVLAIAAQLSGCMVEQPHPVVIAAPPARMPDVPLRSSARAMPRANAAYAIRNVHDGEVITGPKVVGDHFVGVDDDRSKPSQTWTLLPLGGRRFQLQVGDTQECLADHGGGVKEEACDKSDRDQTWVVVQHDGHYEILFRDSSQCLSITSRGKLVDSECHAEPSQLWDFVPR